ncbi:DUF5988 family protein [Streptomyces turgidiscabies]|uniref:DUF5988 family protein n=1 Tax=Streptomyces turgidiscabies TaxID=85558 RepID=UPI0027D7A444|nr:DUF5988 family protein [Streptomyces turgidiscabies]
MTGEQIDMDGRGGTQAHGRESGTAPVVADFEQGGSAPHMRGYVRETKNQRVRIVMDDKSAPNVFLRGGSGTFLSDEERLRYVPDLGVEKVKVLCGNRYEHFEASSETALIGDRELKVFEWAHRTFVAE